LALELNAANITSAAAIIPNEYKSKIFLQLFASSVLPAGSIGSPDEPNPQQYSLLDAAQEIYASGRHIISGTGRVPGITWLEWDAPGEVTQHLIL